MRDKNLVLNDSSQRQVSKDFQKQIKNLIVVLGLDFTLKAVDAIHIFRFVIAARQVDAIGGSEFKEEERENDFDREGTAIDKVTVEEVRVGRTGVPVQCKDIEDTVCVEKNEKVTGLAHWNSFTSSHIWHNISRHGATLTHSIDRGYHHTQ
jgi:hypothetical protein